MSKLKNNHTPLVTVFKRDPLPRWTQYLIRVSAVLISLVISIALASIIVKAGAFEIVGTLFKGAFDLPWKLMLDAALLLGFSIAILPSFKMKYWNMGANGQVMAGCLASCVTMFYLGQWAAKSKTNNVMLIILMLIVAIVASVIFAVIPAIFKAFFGTNETLFTLMTNYIAAALIAYMNYVMAKGQKETPGIINMMSEAGWLPEVINEYFIPVVVIAIITVVIAIYCSKTKHGYEITVIGDSVNTAKYVGMNVKWITIRTLIVNGIVCGIIGFLYTSAINHSAAASSISYGFTGVLVAWLSNFNPIVMVIISFFLSFLTNGTSKISSFYRLGSNNLASVIIGLVFFFIIGSEFFIRFRVRFNLKKKQEKEEM